MLTSGPEDIIMSVQERVIEQRVFSFISEVGYNTYEQMFAFLRNLAGISTVNENLSPVLNGVITARMVFHER